jgi:hypothetical protein
MITHNTVQQIGYLLGMSYTLFNDSPVPENDRDLVARATFIKSNGTIPPLLIFTGLLSIHHTIINVQHNNNYIYILNLKTLKPTKKSYIQIELPTELKELIKSEL